MSAAGGVERVLVFHARCALRGAAGDDLAAALHAECAALRLRGAACVADDGCSGALRGDGDALHRLRRAIETLLLRQLQRGDPSAMFQVHACDGALTGAAADAARAVAFTLRRARTLAELDAAQASALAEQPSVAQHEPSPESLHSASWRPPTAGSASSPVPRAPGAAPRLRLLCLHGFRQSGASLAGHLASLRRRLAADVDFLFLDAPHALPPPASLRGAAAPPGPPRPRRAWLLAPSDAAWSAACDAAAAVGAPPPEPPPLPAPMAGGSAGEHPFEAQSSGWDQSLAAVVAALRCHAPVHGMLGLSQGAAVAAAVAASVGDAPGVVPFRLLWLAGGFVPAAPAGTALRGGAPLRLRSLHVFSGDAHVSAAASEALAARFAAPTLLRHAAGHLLPSGPADVDTYAAWLRGGAPSEPG